VIVALLQKQAVRFDDDRMKIVLETRVEAQALKALIPLGRSHRASSIREGNG
jgi:hypothetical protein